MSDSEQSRNVKRRHLSFFHVDQQDVAVALSFFGPISIPILAVRIVDHTIDVTASADKCPAQKKKDASRQAHI